MGKTVMKWLGLALVWMLVIGWPADFARAAAPKTRMNVAVVEFSVMGDMHEQAGAVMADLMMSAIANSGRFTLKDRLSLSAVAKIAKAQDQELGYTGLLDPRTAADLGQRYGLDAVVIGAVSKPGDLITVTARLIDTKTASLLRSGQIQGKDIDTLQIKINELAAMIAAPPEPPLAYGLTVRTEPADAQIRLLDTSTRYRPGVELAPGNYEIEVAKEGYISRKFPVKMVDSALTVPVTLVPSPEPAKPALRRLTVRPDPPNARVRLLRIRTVYKPGVELAPGSYTVEVSQAGYESKQVSVRIADNDVTVPVKLVKEPEPVKPAQYRLTVRTDPADARVRLMGIRTAYRPGVALTPDNYTVEVSRSGYDSQRVSVRIADSDVTVPVALAKQPEPVKPTQYRLTIRTDPGNAQVRLVNSSFTYRPNLSLPPGNYLVEVSGRGYATQQTPVRIVDRDVTESVTLERIASATPPTPPPPARPGTWRIGSIQLDSSISGVDRAEVQRVLRRHVGQTATRDSLLDSALQVYRSTGMTLSFVVRNATSGSAELQARVSQRLRRTYESSVPLVTRSQIENSGFRVSVE